MNARQAALVALLEAVTPDGFEVDGSVHTGGGCMAMVVYAPDGRELYITNGDADLPYADGDDDLTLGYYTPDGDPLGWSTLMGEDAPTCPRCGGPWGNDESCGFCKRPLSPANDDAIRWHVTVWVDGSPRIDIPG